MPTVTVDGETHKFQADGANGYKSITEGGVTYSLSKDKTSGRYTMTMSGEPAALEKYNFTVGKGRVTNANFGKGDSMENFFKGSVSVGEKKKGDSHFGDFAFSGSHMKDSDSFLLSGAWGLDPTRAQERLQRLAEEAEESEKKRQWPRPGQKRRTCQLLTSSLLSLLPKQRSMHRRMLPTMLSKKSVGQISTF